MGLFEKIFNRLGLAKKTSQQTETVIEELVDSEYLEKLEEELIRSDLGVKLSLDFVNNLKDRSKIPTSQVPQLLKDFLVSGVRRSFSGGGDDPIFKLKLDQKTNIILVVGVNGVGKTTSIGKLAHRLKQQGHKVLIAAGDTFRAAAEEQLNIWAKRADVDILQLEEGSKPSTVVFKAIEKVKAENYDVLIIDTAGRLENKANLMEELSKLKQVITKNLDPNESQTETMLVLDASTGSNALAQAEKFNEVTQLNSVILTKFDGIAKGGMVFALAHQFKLPVKFIGTGEQLEDLQEFNPESFISKIFT